MQRINLFYLLLLFSFLGCVESYIPREVFELPDSYAVFGKITNIADYQVVRVSKSSSIASPVRIPVRGCEVTIIDSENNFFTADSSTVIGDYFIRIGQEHLVEGRAFRIEIKTPKGVFIESAFDTLKSSPEVKELRYFRLDKPTSDPLVFERGIQFEIDLDADDSFDRFYNWELEETYEFRANYPITYYYDGDVHEVYPPDYSLYYCWPTHKITQFYPLSTKNLIENIFIGHKLHFVDNRSQRLMYMYSVLVKQSAISEAYYNFLHQVRKNSSDQEGLFGSQPVNIIGNLESPSHPEVKVLGFFSVESVKSRRFFFSNTMEVAFENLPTCEPNELSQGFGVFTQGSFPLYLVDDEGQLKWLYKICVDCRQSGGTNIKPDYWP